jgi:hypothetical protein
MYLLGTSDGNYSIIRISVRCYKTIRNENYSFKFSRNTKRLIIIGIVVSNTDNRMFEYLNIHIFELFTVDLFEDEYSNVHYISIGNIRLSEYRYFHI